MLKKAHKAPVQREAEAEVEADRDETNPFVIAAETTRMPMVFTDAREAGHPIIFVNDAFLKLTGYERGEVVAQRFDFLLADDASSSDRAAVEAAFAGDTDETEIRYRHQDGDDCCASIMINPVRDEQGEVDKHFVCFNDTTRHLHARRHAAMLIDELNHRVKNTLATVQSIVSQALRNSDDPRVVREAIETRIAALSRSHDLLRREEWGGAGLRDLVGEALAPFGGAGGMSDRFTIAGENIRLAPKAALALGIAFNELATNATKYGALSNGAGTVSIDWQREQRGDGSWLGLHWREQGGPAVEQPVRRGFGSRVIEQGLATELDGRVALDYAPGGLACTINVPTTHVVLDG